MLTLVEGWTVPYSIRWLSNSFDESPEQLNRNHRLKTSSHYIAFSTRYFLLSAFHKALSTIKL